MNFFISFLFQIGLATQHAAFHLTRPIPEIPKISKKLKKIPKKWENFRKIEKLKNQEKMGITQRKKSEIRLEKCRIF